MNDDKEFKKLNSLAYSLRCLESQITYVDQGSQEEKELISQYHDVKEEFLREGTRYFLDESDWYNLYLDDLEFDRLYNGYDE